MCTQHELEYHTHRIVPIHLQTPVHNQDAFHRTSKNTHKYLPPLKKRDLLLRRIGKILPHMVDESSVIVSADEGIIRIERDSGAVGVGGPFRLSYIHRTQYSNMAPYPMRGLDSTAVLRAVAHISARLEARGMKVEVVWFDWSKARERYKVRNFPGFPSDDNDPSGFFLYTQKTGRNTYLRSLNFEAVAPWNR